MKKKRPRQKRITCVHVCSIILSCPTLCNPMDCSPPGSSVRGALQARILGGLPFPPPGDLPDPWIEPVSPVAPTVAGRFFPTELPGKPKNILYLLWNPIILIFGQCLIFGNQILKFSEFSAVKNKKVLLSDLVPGHRPEVYIFSPSQASTMQIRWSRSSLYF